MKHIAFYLLFVVVCWNCKTAIKLSACLEENKVYLQEEKCIEFIQELNFNQSDKLIKKFEDSLTIYNNKKINKKRAAIFAKMLVNCQIANIFYSRYDSIQTDSILKRLDTIYMKCVFESFTNNSLEFIETKLTQSMIIGKMGKLKGELDTINNIIDIINKQKNKNRFYIHLANAYNSKYENASNLLNSNISKSNALDAINRSIKICDSFLPRDSYELRQKNKALFLFHMNKGTLLKQLKNFIAAEQSFQIAINQNTSKKTIDYSQIYSGLASISIYQYKDTNLFNAYFDSALSYFNPSFTNYYYIYGNFSKIRAATSGVETEIKTLMNQIQKRDSQKKLLEGFVPKAYTFTLDLNLASCFLQTGNWERTQNILEKLNFNALNTEDKLDYIKLKNNIFLSSNSFQKAITYNKLLLENLNINTLDTNKLLVTLIKHPAYICIINHYLNSKCKNLKSCEEAELLLVEIENVTATIKKILEINLFLFNDTAIDSKTEIRKLFEIFYETLNKCINSTNKKTNIIKLLVAEESSLNNLIKYRGKIYTNKTTEELKNIESRIFEFDSLLDEKKTIQYSNKINAYSKSDISHKNNKIKSIFREELLTKKIIKYFIGEEFTYAIILDNDKINIHRIDTTNKILAAINTVYLSATGDIRIGSQSHILNAYQYLGERLISSFYPVNEHIQDIVIMPDAELNLIPFEIFTNGKSLPQNYFINYYNFQYAFSFLDLNESENAEACSMAIFSCTNFNNKLVNLPELEKEAETIKQLTNGRKFRHSSKEIFLTNYKQFNALQISTHAKTATQVNSPAALFFESENRIGISALITEEIANLDLKNKKLISLNACETGIGSLNDKLGTPTSIAHAFYVGSNQQTAVLFTLWKTTASEQEKINTKFYLKIKKGISKSKALSEAKREYINENPNKTHPSNWSGYIVAGNNSSIQFQ